MSEGFRAVVTVSVNDEWATEFPDAAIIALSAEKVQRIGKMAEIAAENGLAEVRVYDYTPEYGYQDEDGKFELPKNETEAMYARTECNQMCVSVIGKESAVRWIAYLKHTNIEIETGEIDVRTLLRGEPQEGLIENCGQTQG